MLTKGHPVTSVVLVLNTRPRAATRPASRVYDSREDLGHGPGGDAGDHLAPGQHAAAQEDAPAPLVQVQLLGLEESASELHQNNLQGKQGRGQTGSVPRQQTLLGLTVQTNVRLEDSNGVTMVGHTNTLLKAETKKTLSGFMLKIRCGDI